MRDATRADRPRMNSSEAQCCICWLIFASDTIIEKLHKPYARHPEDNAKTGRVKQRELCTPPEEAGLVCRVRDDGVCVYGTQEDDAIRERMARARAARSKKK